jgi:hypothetical protein
LTTQIGALARIRHLVFGDALATEAEAKERLPRWKALPDFSSDVLSSVAYATQAILYTLLGVGTVALEVADIALVRDRRPAHKGVDVLGGSGTGEATLPTRSAASGASRPPTPRRPACLEHKGMASRG